MQNYYPLVFQLHYNCRQEYWPNQNQELALHMYVKEDFLAGGRGKKKHNTVASNVKEQKTKIFPTCQTEYARFLT